jgi:hypothetical protein
VTLFVFFLTSDKSISGGKSDLKFDIFVCSRRWPDNICVQKHILDCEFKLYQLIFFGCWIHFEFVQPTLGQAFLRGPPGGSERAHIQFCSCDVILVY